MIKRKETFANIVLALFHQLVIIICGFVVPRLLMQEYGSEINGLVSSITQFLSYITLLESGIGGVAKAVMYKPLAEGNISSLSEKHKTVQEFFRKIAIIYIGYCLVLCLFYPTLVNTNISFEFIASLVLVIGISSFSKYFFGISSQILLMADNKSYVIHLIDSICLILNAISTMMLINLRFSIHTVKLGSTIIFFLRPVVIYYIVKRKYNINAKVKSDKEVLKNRWYGLTQHIAYFIHTNTDIVILTLFSNIIFVSIYTVYMMVVNGIEKIINSIITSFNATFGNLYARNELESLEKTFNFVENVCCLLTTVMYSVAYVMIIPFIKIYTVNVKDADYIYPLFAIIMILSGVLYCIRKPYSSLVLSAGFYKETSRDSLIEALLNVIISLILVDKYNLVGVAVGSLIAMSYRTITYIIYLSKNILMHKIIIVLKRLFINITGCILGIIISKVFFLSKMKPAISFLQWISHSLVASIIILVLNILANYIFNREFVDFVIKKLCKFLKGT